MSRYISEILRKLVADRANHRCEYGRTFARFSFLTFHVEHIISIKHGGQSTKDNLAYSCPICNLNKGSDIATFLDDMETPIRFFHPRKDNWNDHFQVEKDFLKMEGLTPTGRATIIRLKTNRQRIMNFRKIAIGNGHPPD